MSKYTTRYQYFTEKKVDWLNDFANKQGEKLAELGVDIDSIKNANHMDNILDIMNKQKKISVDQKVMEYRRLVGMDLLDAMEKAGTDSIDTKEIKAKSASLSKFSLSIRDKSAQHIGDENDILDRVKQYVTQVIKNRDGSITMPAILDQLHTYLKIDTDWLRTNVEEIKKLINHEKNQIAANKHESDVFINDLARTDDPSRGEKEQPLFMPPANTAI